MKKIRHCTIPGCKEQPKIWNCLCNFHIEERAREMEYWLKMLAREVRS